MTQSDGSLGGKIDFDVLAIPLEVFSIITAHQEEVATDPICLTRGVFAAARDIQELKDLLVVRDHLWNEHPVVGPM